MKTPKKLKVIRVNEGLSTEGYCMEAEDDENPFDSWVRFKTLAGMRRHIQAMLKAVQSVCEHKDIEQAGETRDSYGEFWPTYVCQTCQKALGYVPEHKHPARQDKP